ncbi:MAG: hypothetical protein H0X14_05605, partial [Acidobacteria bacterium]|nr:hypothetical protein [Acidobacteriota bacterium]
MATALALLRISLKRIRLAACAEGRAQAGIDLIGDLAYKLDVSASPFLSLDNSLLHEFAAGLLEIKFMKKRERNTWLKGCALLALALALIILPVGVRLLNSSPVLAAQSNSNRSSSGTSRRRGKRVRNSSNVNQATDRRAIPLASQNDNGQTSNSSGQQSRPPYKVEDPRSDVKLDKIMTIGDKELTPEMIEPVGAEITYTTFFNNQGNAPSRSLNIIDPIQDRTDFKLESVINDLGTTGLKVAVNYSKDGGETCDYTPVSGS